MSETSADAPASSDDEVEAPLYPLEGKYLSQTDRETILGLPEIERETILADRAQQILRREQDIQLQRQLAASEAAASKRKRKAGAADLEESARKTSRPKVGKVGRSALDDYKKAREAKGAERTRFDSGKDTRRERSRSGSDDGYGDRDRDRDRYTRDDSEVEWADSYSRRERDEAPAELKDFDRCRIGRTAFAKVCFYPNFEQTMKGCFARVSIGLNRETGENMYRMAQIKGGLLIAYSDHLTSMLTTTCRFHPRQALHHGTPICNQQTPDHRRVRPRLPRQRRKTMAFLRLLRFSAHLIGALPIRLYSREGTHMSSTETLATAEAGRHPRIPRSAMG